MTLILIILHIAACVGLIMIVLLQRGKGASLGVAFGGSSQTVFGSAGATSFLHKITAAAAIIFMLTSLGLSVFFGRGVTSSLMENVTKQKVPAAEKTELPAHTGETGK
jgi:preprotein translocase subunit SecG